MGNFVIIRAKNGEHYFNLKADNSQILLTSQLYSSKTDCINDIESVRNNFNNDTMYERNKTAENKHFFVLKSSNGQIISKSELYASKAEMENGIESIKKNANNKQAVEEEPYF
jgi:hypothetical protein